MPSVELLSEDNVSAEVKPIFAKLKEKYGEVPPPLRAMANHPEYLKLVLQKMETVMGSDALTKETKLAIAFAVSTVNNCEMCINNYGKELREAGFSDQQIVEILAVIDLVGSMNHFNNGMMIKPSK